jgi:protein involved in polysaccharide export with SLBB domain
MRTIRAAVLAASCLAAAAGSLAAQVGAALDPGRTQATRAALQETLQLLEQSGASSAYSDRLRSNARRQAALIRQRLEEGDFQVGDRVLLTVEGEQSLRDTFAVETGRVLNLPQIGAVPLAGVLRSELNSYLTERIGRFVRTPQVTTYALLRVSIMGAVNRPGFYTIPAGIIMEDVLQTAGGIARDAKLLDIRIERNEQAIWDGQALTQAITEGRTIDQLGVRAGDRIFVPQERRGGSTLASLVRYVPMLLTLTFTLTRLL